jgi:hypothetical protein
MKVEVHVLRYGDSWLVPYVIRHYLTYATKLVIHDAGGGPIFMGVEWDNLDPRIHFVPWDCKQVDDLKYAELRNTCWKGTDADWVIVADLDELIYFPEGAEKSLGAYTQMGAAVIRPHGFEMFSETYPLTTGQIYDEIKQGAPDDKWYSKPILFSPKLVSETRLGLGSHESDPVLHDERRFHVGPKWPFAKPAAWLLHFHAGIGPIEDLAAKFDATKSRMCEANLKNRWGNIEDGLKHATDKRNGMSEAGIRKIIP